MDYCVLITAYNEEKYIEEVIDSILKQTIKPKMFLIVDDNSSDRTLEIIREKKVQVLQLKNPKSEDLFKNRCNAFKVGLVKVLESDPLFIFKLDADSVVPPNYCELLIQELEKNPEIGSISGYSEEKAKLHLRANNGAIMYRRGAVRPEWVKSFYGWDMLLILLAEFYGGFESRTVDDLKYIDHRPPSNSLGLREWYHIGRSRRMFGYGWSNILLYAFVMISKKPHILGSMAMLFGFMVHEPNTRDFPEGFIRMIGEKSRIDNDRRRSYLKNKIGFKGMQ